jgi:hypothetical protein
MNKNNKNMIDQNIEDDNNDTINDVTDFNSKMNNFNNKLSKNKNIAINVKSNNDNSYELKREEDDNDFMSSKPLGSNNQMISEEDGAEMYKQFAMENDE